MKVNFTRAKRKKNSSIARSHGRVSGWVGARKKEHDVKGACIATISPAALVSSNRVIVVIWLEFIHYMLHIWLVHHARRTRLPLQRRCITTTTEKNKKKRVSSILIPSWINYGSRYRTEDTQHTTHAQRAGVGSMRVNKTKNINLNSIYLSFFFLGCYLFIFRLFSYKA